MLTMLVEWQAYRMPNYDTEMERTCGALQQRIIADPEFRTSILVDPRDLHRSLFSAFTPPGFEEYAGTYRGTVGTTLEARRPGAPSLFAHVTAFEQ